MEGCRHSHWPRALWQLSLGLSALKGALFALFGALSGLQGLPVSTMTEPGLSVPSHHRKAFSLMFSSRILPSSRIVAKGLATLAAPKVRCQGDAVPGAWAYALLRRIMLSDLRAHTSLLSKGLI
jgi:hypothetical protein